MTQIFCRATASGCQSLERQATRLALQFCNHVIPSAARNLSFAEENHVSRYWLVSLLVNPLAFFECDNSNCEIPRRLRGSG